MLLVFPLTSRHCRLRTFTWGRWRNFFRAPRALRVLSGMLNSSRRYPAGALSRHDLISVLPQTCIELREKYLRYSCQRLEDNPINYDGRFAPSNNSTSTSASHPPSPERATPASTPQVTSPPPLAGSSRGESSSRPRENGILSAGPASFKPWKIYPPPPRPHWEAVDPAANAWSSAEPAQSGPYEFRFDDCEIPGSHPFSFDLDSQGVYQVYADEKTGAHLARWAGFHVPLGLRCPMGMAEGGV